MGKIASVKGKVTALDGEVHVLPFINPATGEQFGEVMIATQDEIKTARREMDAAAKTWSAKSVKRACADCEAAAKVDCRRGG